MLALLLAAQLSAAVSLTAQVASAPQVRDRESFGVRYRTPALGRLTLQAGLVVVSENGLGNKTRAGLQHFAVGLEGAVTPHWRLAAIYGNLDEVRGTDADVGLPRTSYYRLWAAGSEFHGALGSLTVERLLQVPVSTPHAARHEWTVRGQTKIFGLLASELSQADGRFWAGELTVRPLTMLPSPYRYLILTGGTRTMLDPHADRNMMLRFMGIGLSWTTAP